MPHSNAGPASKLPAEGLEPTLVCLMTSLVFVPDICCLIKCVRYWLQTLPSPHPIFFLFGKRSLSLHLARSLSPASHTSASLVLKIVPNRSESCFPNGFAEMTSWWREYDAVCAEVRALKGQAAARGRRRRYLQRGVCSELLHVIFTWSPRRRSLQGAGLRESCLAGRAGDGGQVVIFARWEGERAKR